MYKKQQLAGPSDSPQAYESQICEVWIKCVALRAMGISYVKEVSTDVLVKV